MIKNSPWKNRVCVTISFQRVRKGTHKLSPSHLHSLVQQRAEAGCGGTQELPPSPHEALTPRAPRGLRSVPNSLQGNSLHSPPCTCAITGTDYYVKYASVAIKVSTVLRLQMCCDYICPCGLASSHCYLMFCRSLWSLPVVNHLIPRLSALRG